MPVHDWTRARGWEFHHFHTMWMTHLAEHLNGGGLPDGYYAYAEMRAEAYSPDVLTLTAGSPQGGGVAVAVQAADRKVVAQTRPATGRLLSVRRAGDERMVAVIEIVSPRNKDRAASVGEFAGKILDLLQVGIHAVVIDLLPPGRHDPGGMHPAVWEEVAGANAPDPAPADRPLTFAAYQALDLPVAYLYYAAVGQRLPDVPLFLDGGSSVNLPLEDTYMRGYTHLPAGLRALLG
jgi:hypothetical protein